MKLFKSSAAAASHFKFNIGSYVLLDLRGDFSNLVARGGKSIPIMCLSKSMDNLKRKYGSTTMDTKKKKY